MTSQPDDNSITSDLIHDPGKLPLPSPSHSNTVGEDKYPLPSSQSCELWDIKYPVEVDYDALLDENGEWDPSRGDPFLQGWEWTHPSEE